jgi:preprotein translocase subunit YajC
MGAVVSPNQGTSGVSGTAGIGQPATPQALPAASQPGSAGSLGFLLLMFGLLAFMVLMTFMSGRKERKRRAELLSSLSSNDRVMTIGGVIGTIVELRDDEVVLRVDESTNTRIRFSRASVQQVMSRGGSRGDTIAEAKNGKQKVSA